MKKALAIFQGSVLAKSASRFDDENCDLDRSRYEPDGSGFSSPEAIHVTCRYRKVETSPAMQAVRRYRQVAEFYEMPDTPPQLSLLL